VGATVGFGYDDNGNRVFKDDDGDVTVFAYSPENRLESVDLASDGDDVTMVYDASGTRVSRSHGGWSTTYVGGMVEIDRTGETVTASRRLYRFGGAMVAVGDNTAVSFLFQDRLGSTVAAFDDTTNTASEVYYYPYGAERDTVGVVGVDQRYTGQTSDIAAVSAGTGLVYYQARYYDPQVAAFAAADTLIPTVGLSAGLNRYAYVSDNPTNATDPTGNTGTQLTPFRTGDSRDRMWSLWNLLSHELPGPDDTAALNQAENEGLLTGSGTASIVLPPTLPEEPDYGDYDWAAAWHWLVDDPQLITGAIAAVGCVSGLGGPWACLALMESATVVNSVDYYLDTGDVDGAVFLGVTGTVLNIGGFFISVGGSGATPELVAISAGPVASSSRGQQAASWIIRLVRAVVARLISNGPGR